ncbi:MAG: hypothetical protein LW711_17655 [Saprospiraceae bacterium]|nr:hypothetical protein [Saprospiraceae bacterium]
MNKESLEIPLKNDLKEEIFYNALCNSLDYMMQIREMLFYRLYSLMKLYMDRI